MWEVFPPFDVIKALHVFQLREKGEEKQEEREGEKHSIQTMFLREYNVSKKNLSNNNSKHLLAIQHRTQNISKHLLASHIRTHTNLKAWDGGRGVCCICAAYMHVHVSVGP